MIQQSLTIRPAIADDADRIGQLAKQFAAYLRDLGDTTDFKFDAQACVRDRFGPAPDGSKSISLFDSYRSIVPLLDAD